VSRIDDLVAELCPNGVEFLQIGEVVRRAPNLKWDERQSEEFQYIDLSSVDRVTNRILKTVTIDRESAPSRAQQEVRAGDVLFGTTRPMLKRYCLVGDDYDGQVASTGFCVLRPTERITSEWLYHLLGTPDFYDYVETNQRGASYPAISDSLVKRFKIPAPPLAIQREITAILDKMESLKAELESELESELEYRYRQYAFYRDQLLTFREADEVPWAPMGDLASVRVGQAPRAGSLVDDGQYLYVNAGTTPSGRIAEMNTNGDTVTIPSRGQGGVGIAGYQARDFWCGPLCYRIKSATSDLSTRFLYYYLKSVQPAIRALQQTGGTPALNRKELVLVRVPVPPHAEQERIVAILDKFDALVNDLSIGLPAEIAARQKQYEYYRDKLLTFKEAA